MHYKINSNILWRKVDGEIVIVDADTDGYSYLNHSAASIFELISKGLSEEEIIQQLAELYDVSEVPAQDVRESAKNTVEELVKLKYITKE